MGAFILFFFARRVESEVTGGFVIESTFGSKSAAIVILYTTSVQCLVGHVVNTLSYRFHWRQAKKICTSDREMAR